jgi:hypothetical protein
LARNGFQLAADLVWIHGKRGGETDQHRPQGGVPTAYRSVPAAVFLLAFATGEQLVKAASEREGIMIPAGKKKDQRPKGIGNAGLVEDWAIRGVALRARARVAPSKPNVGIADWVVLEGDDLQQYLRDAYLIRNRLAHNGSLIGLGELESRYFFRVRPDHTEEEPSFAKPSVTLPIAEGMLQAAQDIAYLIAASEDRCDWQWELPAQSRTGRMKNALWHDPAFPLPPRE